MILVKIQFCEGLIQKKYNIFQSLKKEMLIRTGQVSVSFFGGKNRLLRYSGRYGMSVIEKL